MITPDWPAPDNIKAANTTRIGGVSLPPYDSFNLANHVGDSVESVASNRGSLTKLAPLPNEPLWLEQTHSTLVIDSHNWHSGIEADAIISHIDNHVCVVMTADCLPILLCNKQGDTVAAVHAGWRGLAAGIIEKTIHSFSCDPHDIMVWLGPAIGPSQFEVGVDVYHAFTQHDPQTKLAFQQSDPDHYLADIYRLARQRLNNLGISAIYGGDYCTVTDHQRFFSYRRDGVTGRMASLIWIDGNY